jgi:hypothetical protein
VGFSFFFADPTTGSILNYNGGASGRASDENAGPNATSSASIPVATPVFTGSTGVNQDISVNVPPLTVVFNVTWAEFGLRGSGIATSP